MTVPVERNETYTYTSPAGVAFVVTGVPALVYKIQPGVRDVRFKPAASRVVDAYIRRSLQTHKGSDGCLVSFEEARKALVVDAGT